MHDYCAAHPYITEPVLPTGNIGYRSGLQHPLLFIHTGEAA